MPKSVPFKKVLLKVLLEINKHGYAPADLAEDIKLESSSYVTKSLKGEIKEHNSKKNTRRKINPLRFRGPKISTRSNCEKTRIKSDHDINKLILF